MDRDTQPKRRKLVQSHTDQCQRLWSLDSICCHGVIRCIVCKREYDSTNMQCIHSVNDIDDALKEIGQTLE